MANKKMSGEKIEQEEGQKKAKEKTKKMIRNAAIIIAALVVIIIFDYVRRNPRIKDETDALNVFISKVLNTAIADAIGSDDPFSLENLDPVEINKKIYYPVRLCGKDENGEEFEVVTVYFYQRNSKVFLMGEGGALVPYVP